MKCCLNYYKKCKVINNVNEVTLPYENNLDFLENIKILKDKRVNLEIKNIDDIELKKINKIKNEYDIYLLLDNYNDDIIKKIKEYDIKFFINKNVGDIDTFYGMIELGVSDIYIMEDLCFQLEGISNFAHSRNISLRTFANVCQTNWKTTNSLKTFFIRPEDLNLYEKYIDTIEFILKRKEDFDIFYKIYFEDKKWFGKLNEIIVGFNSDLDSRFILPRFAERRLNCNKKCMKNGKCNMCEIIEELSKTLKEKNIYISKEEEK